MQKLTHVPLAIAIPIKPGLTTLKRPEEQNVDIETAIELTRDRWKYWRHFVQTHRQLREQKKKKKECSFFSYKPIPHLKRFVQVHSLSVCTYDYENK